MSVTDSVSNRTSLVVSVFKNSLKLDVSLIIEFVVFTTLESSVYASKFGVTVSVTVSCPESSSLIGVVVVK